jgi:hypothetical protein
VADGTREVSHIVTIKCASYIDSITLDGMIAIPVSLQVTVHRGIMHEPRTNQQGQRQRERFTPRDIPPFITAIAALITAFVAAAAFFVGRATGAPTPTATVTVTAPASEASNPGSVGSSASPSNNGTTTPTSSGVWHQGVLVLSSGQDADLDAPISDPHWGVLTENDEPGTGLDINWDASNGLGFPGWGFNVQMVLLPGDVSGSDPCATAPGYSHNPIPTGKIVQGVRVCVYTSEERYSLLTVKSVKPDYSEITFQVVTFKNGND